MSKTKSKTKTTRAKQTGLAKDLQRIMKMPARPNPSPGMLPTAKLDVRGFKAQHSDDHYAEEAPSCEWTYADLTGDAPSIRARQKVTFGVMLRTLEKNGDCREVFHTLALALFGSRMD